MHETKKKSKIKINITHVGGSYFEGLVEDDCLTVGQRDYLRSDNSNGYVNELSVYGEYTHRYDNRDGLIDIEIDSIIIEPMTDNGNVLDILGEDFNENEILMEIERSGINWFDLDDDKYYDTWRDETDV
jgi:hypothetical protein